MSLVFQGTNASALEKDIGPEQFPINEHYFGLVNVSITKSSHTITKVIAKENSGVVYPNKPSWVWVICWSVSAEVTALFVSLLANEGMFPQYSTHINTLHPVSAKGIKNIWAFFQLILQNPYKMTPPPLLFCPHACSHVTSFPQFGNTCYCNSVLQALYFCRPFRENVLAYKAQQKKKENLLTCLADLFHSIATQKKKVGVIPPKKFISRLRKENGEIPKPEAEKASDDFVTKIKI